jgi:hypothetical protein
MDGFPKALKNWGNRMRSNWEGHKTDTLYWGEPLRLRQTKLAHSQFFLWRKHVRPQTLSPILKLRSLGKIEWLLRSSLCLG